MSFTDPVPFMQSLSTDSGNLSPKLYTGVSNQKVRNKSFFGEDDWAGARKPDQKLKQKDLTAAVGADFVENLGDLVIDKATLAHQLANLLIGVHNGGVIAATKESTDFWK